MGYKSAKEDISELLRDAQNSPLKVLFVLIILASSYYLTTGFSNMETQDSR
jgi:hypothetical protein